MLSVELTRLSEAMAGAAADVGVSRTEFLLAGLHASLYRYGNESLAIAVHMSTRPPGGPAHIGLFVTELPSYGAPTADMPFSALAGRVREKLRRVAPYLDHNGSDRAPLHVQVVDAPSELTMSLRSATAALSGSAVEGIATHLQTLLAGATADPGTPIGDLPLLSRRERPVATDAIRPPEPRPLTTAAALDALPVADGMVSAVRRVFCQVLEVDAIGPEDNLFDLGAHSSSITQIITRLRAMLDVEVPLHVFFDDPTVSGVVAAISSDCTLEMAAG